MSPDKSAIDLALSGKYLAWDSSALNDVFTTRDHSIFVIQLRRHIGILAYMRWENRLWIMLKSSPFLSMNH